MKKLNQHKAELDKLQAEKISLSEKIGSLQANRSAAVRALAGGDEQKEAAVQQIEAKIAPLNAKMEGLEDLIAEAKAAVDEAEEDLKKAEVEENARLQAFIAERERQEREKFIASLVAREEKIINLHHRLCEEIGEIQLAKILYDGDGSLELERWLMSLPAKITESIKDKGLRPLMARGFANEIFVWPLVNSPELSATYPGRGPFNAIDVVQVRKEKRVQEIIAEYRSKK